MKIQDNPTKIEKVNLKSPLLPCTSKNLDSVEIRGDQTSAPALPKEYTIIFYLGGDNFKSSTDLKESQEKLINDLEAFGSNENINIICQFDRGGEDCKRYLIKKDNDLEKINSPVLMELGSVNIADADSITSLITYAKENHPAKHSAFVLNDHGFSWQNVIGDKTSNAHASSEIVGNAIKKAGGVDVLIYESCLMGSIENAFAHRDNAEYLIASENSCKAVTGFDKFSFTGFLETLNEAITLNKSVKPVEFGLEFMKTAEKGQETFETLSMVDLKNTEKVVESINVFARAILETPCDMALLRKLMKNAKGFGGYFVPLAYFKNIANCEEFSDEIRKAANNAVKLFEEGKEFEAFSLYNKEIIEKHKNDFIKENQDTETVFQKLQTIDSYASLFIDIIDFAAKIIECGEIDDKNLKSAAKNLIDTIKKSIVFEYHKDSATGANGLTINSGTVNYDEYKETADKYSQIPFSKAALWDEALQKIWEGAQPDLPYEKVRKFFNRCNMR